MKKNHMRGMIITALLSATLAAFGLSFVFIAASDCSDQHCTGESYIGSDQALLTTNLAFNDLLPLSVGFTLTETIHLPIITKPYRNGPIAFTSDRNGNFDIYVMREDGTDILQLTTNSNNDFGPSWSADGTKIVFVSRRDGNAEIYVMNADGSDQIRLTMNSWDDLAPSWSPDGSKIVFHSVRNQLSDIFVINSDGSNEKKLTDGLINQTPDWSPDGSRIAYASFTYPEITFDILVMDPDGSNKVNLTNFEGEDEDGYNPSWSHDGSKIAFVYLVNGYHEIYIMNADGTEQTRLTIDPPGDRNYSPSWSTDDSKIVFTSQRDSNHEIYSMKSDGSEQTNLTNNVADDREPSWSPVLK